MISFASFAQREVTITIHATKYTVAGKTIDKPVDVVLNDEYVDILYPDSSADSFNVAGVYKSKWEDGKGTIYDLNNGDELLVVKGYQWAILYRSDGSEIHYDDALTYTKDIYKDR
jgi:hypothetical protein